MLRSPTPCFTTAPFVLHNVTLCYAMPCRVTLCSATLWYVMLRYIMLCYTLLCCVVPPLVSPQPLSCYIMLCYAMLCHVVLRYVLQRYGMVCEHHSLPLSVCLLFARLSVCPSVCLFHFILTFIYEAFSVWDIEALDSDVGSRHFPAISVGDVCTSVNG